MENADYPSSFLAVSLQNFSIKAEPFLQMNMQKRLMIAAEDI
jgi:hypothetical protein